MTLVAFGELDVKVPPTCTPQQVEGAIADQLVKDLESELANEAASLMAPLEEKMLAVAGSLLTHVIHNAALVEISKYCFGLYLVYSLAQTLRYNDEPLIRARGIFGNPELKEFIKENRDTQVLDQSTSKQDSNEQQE